MRASEKSTFDTGSTPNEAKSGLRGESDASQPSDTLTDDSEAPKRFSSRSKGIYTDRHHVEPRVNLCVTEEESFPIPLRYTDEVRRKIRPWMCRKKNVQITGTLMATET